MGHKICDDEVTGRVSPPNFWGEFREDGMESEGGGLGVVPHGGGPRGGGTVTNTGVH